MAGPAERTVRIGCASGFWGDSEVGAPQLVAGGELDYLVFDYLAETTMAILAGARARRPELGYATDFVDVAMRSVLPELARRRIRVIANAGGIHPRGCAEALARAAAEAGVRLRIAVVEGDDVTPLLPALRQAGQADPSTGERLPERVLSANAYLGAYPIAAALAAGAEVVITGRCVDSALVLGPLVHEFGWKPSEHDLLAAGSLAGHIVECGCQATGGLHTDWERVERWAEIGYPVIECGADGTFVVTKPEGTGGLVAPETVAEQLVYEIGDPAAYLLPDVVCDFREVRMEQVGKDRVRVRGARGRPPTGDYKVSATWLDGFRSAGTLVIVGIDAVAKAERTGAAILERTRAIFRRRGLPDYGAAHVEVIGAETLYGPHSRARQAREVMLRVVVNHPSREALEIFSREIAPAATSWAPGTTGPGVGRPPVSPLVKQLSFPLPKSALSVRVVIDGEPRPVEVPPGGGPPVEPAAAGEPPPAPPPGRTVRLPLVRLAWARSGDKGNTSNIGVIARRPELLPVLLAQVTPAAVKAWLAHLVKGEVRRYLLPGIHACNFVLLDALDGGGTASMRMDPLGKGMAQLLLDMPVDVPEALARGL